MRLRSEDQILDVNFRKAVIADITSTENVNRKNEYLKRYELYKDQIKKWVVKKLANEGLKPETVARMENRAGSVSIAKKIVNKLARAYSNGVSREAGTSDTTSQINDLARLLDFDRKMKNSDRYRRLHRNGGIQIVPEPVELPDGMTKWKLKMRALNPWQYDVIEDYYDREVPRVWVISDFVDRSQTGTHASESEAATHGAKLFRQNTNNKDTVLADAPEDAGKGEQRTFIWWSDRYHFTTDEKGEVIDAPDEELKNPIGMMPIVNNADGQDGQFWALGGDDVTDGTILVNTLITDRNSIAFMQGWGQFVVTGQNLKDKITIGPDNAMVLDYQGTEGEPTPTVDVVSANPPLGDWENMIEQYVALLLTTNNLSPRNVSGSLQANNVASGIAMLIESSEATDDISDVQRDYVDKERRLWEITKRWQNLYMETGSLVDKFAKVGTMPDDLEVSIKFNEPKPITTEKDRLETIKLRKELGINEKADLVMLDNPDMTREEAQEKLQRIADELSMRMEQSFRFQQQEDETEDEGDED